MKSKLQFKPITEFEPGIIFEILSKSYEELTKLGPEFYKLRKKWKNDDKSAFENLDTIGKCYFITCLNNIAIGMSSYDPRQDPIGIVGDNCILPEFRGHGYGKLQLEEILRRFKERGFTRAKVSTGEHPFFRSAQHNYLSVGFHETRRFKKKPESKFMDIEYEMEL